MQQERKLPEIRIEFAHFLDPIFIAYVKSNPKNKDWAPPNRKEVEEKIEAYETEWKKYEKMILGGMTSVLDLEFYQNTIDVYIVTAYRGAFSNPLIISSTLPPDVFVDILTHEILHRLLTDNTKKVDVRKIWKEMFPNEELLARNHIFVHAVHKYIYLEIFKDSSRFKRDIDKPTLRGYKRAWKIVEEKGYQELIELLKNKY